MKYLKELEIGKLYWIDIPERSRLVFGNVEYFSNDVFLILKRPQYINVGDGDRPYYSVKALVRDNIVHIHFLKNQISYFKRFN